MFFVVCRCVCYDVYKKYNNAIAVIIFCLYNRLLIIYVTALLILFVINQPCFIPIINTIHEATDYIQGFPLVNVSCSRISKPPDGIDDGLLVKDLTYALIFTFSFLIIK